MAKKERVSVYIDGFNLYFGIRSKYPLLKWLDVEALSKNLLKPNQELVSCTYFTARVRNNHSKERRQSKYLDALQTTNVNIIYGNFYSKPVSCHRCQNTWRGNEEKMTDVNIAVQIMTDALEDKYDTAIIISGDSDLTPPVRAIKKFYTNKKVIVAFPPNRSSYELKNISHGSFTIGRVKLSSSQLPNSVKTKTGYEIVKPAEWN